MVQQAIQGVLNCLTQLTSHCLSKSLTINYMYFCHYSQRRLTLNTIYTLVLMIDN